MTHVCYQTKFQKGTQDLVHKDKREPTRDCSVGTKLDYINKHTKMHAWTYRQKMQRCKETKDANRDGTKQTKQACYHTKGKGKHVIRHIKRLTWETLTCKAKQRRERLVTSVPNITRMYSQAWLHPNKPQKGTDATKEVSGPKRPTSHKPTKGRTNKNMAKT